MLDNTNMGQAEDTGVSDGTDGSSTSKNLTLKEIIEMNKRKIRGQEADISDSNIG